MTKKEMLTAMFEGTPYERRINAIINQKCKGQIERAYNYYLHEKEDPTRDMSRTLLFLNKIL